MFNFSAEWLDSDLSEISIEERLFKNPECDNRRSSDYAVVITRWENWDEDGYFLVGFETANGKFDYRRYNSVQDVNDFIRLELNPKSMGEASYKQFVKRKGKGVFSLL